MAKWKAAQMTAIVRHGALHEGIPNYSAPVTLPYDGIFVDNVFLEVSACVCVWVGGWVRVWGGCIYVIAWLGAWLGAWL